VTSLQIDILSVSLQVHSNSSVVTAKLKELLGFFSVREVSALDASSAQVSFEVKHSRGNCSLNRNGKLILETDHLAYFIASLEFQIFEEVLRLEKEHLLLHAGALAFEGRGLILPAAKRAGKSTLVAGLLSHGFLYCSDEPAAINFQSGKLVPLPRVIHVKDTSPLDRSIADGSISMAAYDDSSSDYQARYALVRPDQVVQQPVELGCLLFPNYKSDGQNRLTALRGSQTAVHMARQALNLPEQLEQGFDLTAKIAADKPAYQLEFNSLPAAAELICNIIGA
jgi:hypothetical protein